MNRLAHWMMRLYPARWRARYGDELDALLADTGADARVVTDLFRGGMRMQFKTWSFLKLAVTLGLAGLLLGVGAAQLLPLEYTSKATVQVQPTQIRDGDIGGSAIKHQLNDEIQMAVTQVFNSRTVLSGIINNPRILLYRDVLTNRSLDEVIEEMRQNTRVQFVALPGKLNQRVSAFDVVFTYHDRYKAQQTTQAIVDAFGEALSARSVAAAKGFSEARLDVLDGASLPDSPFFPSRPTMIIGGFLFGVLVASVWRMTQRTGFIVRRFALVALIFGIAGTPLYMVAHALFLLPYQYRSAATVRLQNTPEEIAELKNDVLSRTSLSMIVNDPRLMLYKDRLRTMPLEDVIQTMKQHVTIRHDGNHEGAIITVAFDYFDNYKARQTVNALLSRFDEAERRLFRNAAPLPAFTPVVMDVLDEPNLPWAPTRTRRAIAGAGCVIGVMIAASVALIRRRWRPEPDFPVDVVQG